MATNSRVQYRLEVDRDDWTTWRDTIYPHSKTINDRLVELIDADAERDGELIALADAGDTDTDRIALLRIRKAAMRASQEVGDDPEAAREEITTILNTLDDAI
jgi:hypothetical protein